MFGEGVMNPDNPPEGVEKDAWDAYKKDAAKRSKVPDKLKPKTLKEVKRMLAEEVDEPSEENITGQASDENEPTEKETYLPTPGEEENKSDDNSNLIMPKPGQIDDTDGDEELPTSFGW